MRDANLGDGANGRLSEAERAALRLQIRQALVTAWRDDYSVGTVVSGVTECLEDYLAALVREHTERAWDEGAINVIEKVIRLAKANATLARANGRSEEERRWLDLIHALEADLANFPDARQERDPK